MIGKKQTTHTDLSKFDRSNLSLGGGTVLPNAAEIMPTGVVHPTAVSSATSTDIPACEELSLFGRWYLRPLEALRQLPNGDGGFAALIIVCPLYERYVQHRRGRSSDHDIASQLVGDFGLSRSDAQTVWDVVRHGLLHSAMLKNQSGPVRRSWTTHYRFDCPFEVDPSTTPATLRIQPWLFVDHVVALYERDPSIVTSPGDWPSILTELT